MDWTRAGSAETYVSGPAKIRVTESGPARVAVEVSRETGITICQTIRLSAEMRANESSSKTLSTGYPGVEPEGDVPLALRIARLLTTGTSEPSIAHGRAEEIRSSVRTSGST